MTFFFFGTLSSLDLSGPLPFPFYFTWIFPQLLLLNGGVIHSWDSRRTLFLSSLPLYSLSVGVFALGYFNFYSRYRDFWALVLVVLYPPQFFWLRRVTTQSPLALHASRTFELSQRRGRADRNPHSLVLITCYPYISFVYSCNGCFESCCEVWNIVELINLPSGALTVSFIPGFDSNTCIVSSTEIYRPSRN